MKEISNKIFGLSQEAKEKLIKENKKPKIRKIHSKAKTRSENSFSKTNPSFYQFDKFPEYQQIQIQKLAAEKLNISTPYFKTHDGIAKSTTYISGEKYINYASYDYIDLSGHALINQASTTAIERYSTTVSASRPVSGERALHHELEQKLSELHGTEESLLFVGGHAANVNTIACLLGEKDLIIHDSLIHNSVIQGAILSGAKRLSFPHNDTEQLNRILKDVRNSYQKVLVVIEGLYSMEGDYPELPEFIHIKNKYKTLLMVDEAHSIGVLGKKGKGICEYFNISGNEIDIIMGTLSKSLVSCGGYISGKKELIEILKYSAPGFVFSVGISPPVVAAALQALKILESEPDRVEKLQENCQFFFQLINNAGLDAGLDTGTCMGYSIVPVITGNSLLTVKLSNNLYSRGINVQPIIYPAVEEKAARLRFFLSSGHTKAQLQETAQILQEEYKKCKKLSIKSLF